MRWTISAMHQCVLASFLGKRAECTRSQKRAGSLLGNTSTLLFGLTQLEQCVLKIRFCSMACAHRRKCYHYIFGVG